MTTIQATCTRRLAFDAAHRIMRHGSKCRHLHGHRYVVEVTCRASTLDDLGRVVDFGDLKTICGAWLDDNLDHGTLLNSLDLELLYLCSTKDWKVYVFDEQNPTAEVIAQHLFAKFSSMLGNARLEVESVKVWETPNCSAEVTR